MKNLPTSRQYIAGMFPLMLGMVVVSILLYQLDASAWTLWAKTLLAVGFIAASFIGMCFCMARAESLASGSR